MKNSNLERTVIIVIILSGVIISLLQFTYNRSLWLDEAYLALNIINRSPFELLKPLDFYQAAPILFLEIEKLFSELIPNSEFGLRFLPLVSFWLSLFLFYKIVKAIHQNYYTIIFSLSLFVFNGTLIYYSSEVKQYMTDVLILTSIYYLLVRSYKKEENKYYLLGIVGAVSIWLSTVAPIIVCTAGLYLLVDMYRNNRKQIVPLAIVSIVWVSSFVLFYLIFVHNHPARDHMTRAWDNYKAFMPGNPLNKEFYRFLFDKASMIIHSLFHFGSIGGITLSILSLIGILSLITKRRIDVIILSITPLMLHLLLSSLKLYPFESRLILYTCPCLIIICSFGFDYLASSLPAGLKMEGFRPAAIVIPLLLMCYCFYSVKFPMKRNEIKESINFIEQNMYKGDKVYVNYFARIPFQYYDEISFVKLDSNSVVIATENNIPWDGNKNTSRFVPDTLKYSHEVGLLRGRVWFLFTSAGDEGDKMKLLLNHFKSRGISIVQEFHTNGSDAYLYNISN